MELAVILKGMTPAIIDAVLPFYIILGVITLYAIIEGFSGHFVRSVIVLSVAFALLILFTDLRSEAEFIRSQFSFNGLIVPEYVDNNMPVFDVSQVDFETGVITGGWNVTPSSEEDTGSLLDSCAKSFLLCRKT